MITEDVIQAWGEGQEIQFKGTLSWETFDLSQVNIDALPYLLNIHEWRIKPIPLDIVKELSKAIYNIQQGNWQLAETGLLDLRKYLETV